MTVGDDIRVMTMCRIVSASFSVIVAISSMPAALMVRIVNESNVRGVFAMADMNRLHVCICTLTQLH